MTLPEFASSHPAWLCKVQFWHALQRKDAALLAQVLHAEFVCRSPEQPDQQRATFIASLTSIPVTIQAVHGEQIALLDLGDVAVLTGIQIAGILLPTGDRVVERLALSNVFQRDTGQWSLLLAHPVTLTNA